MKRLKTVLGISVVCVAMMISSCARIDLYEKVVSIPNFQWQSSYKPQFTFRISDTTVPYQVFIVLRHNDQYNYNNIWVNLYTELPADSSRRDTTHAAVDSSNSADSIQKVQYELPLANKERWLGTAMGDVYEHRVLITPKPVYFTRTGEYKYTIEHAMREDPLLNMLNVGLRIEKKSP